MYLDIYSHWSSQTRWLLLAQLLCNNKQVVLRGGPSRGSDGWDTWILNPDSKTWRRYTSEEDDIRVHHTACRGLSKDVIIIGGIKCPNILQHNFHVQLEPKKLQQLAMKTVYKYQNDLPHWKKYLPEKLIRLMY